MADRYQNAAQSSRESAPGARRTTDNDPLAELARLIGQADTFGDFAKEAGFPAQPPAARAPDVEPQPPAGAPSWVQRAASRQQSPAVQTPVPQSQYSSYRTEPPAVRAPQPPAPPLPPAYGESAQAYDDAAHYAAAPQGYQGATVDPGADPYDPSRYDEVLYGQQDSAADYDPYAAQPQDGYADQYGQYDGYADAAEPPRKRRGGMMTVAAVLALAVVGTAGAYGYRSYVGSPRSGEPPIIKADPGPTKIVPPTQAEASGKPIQDRLASASGTERMVSREEQPVDVTDPTRAGPKAVLPAFSPGATASIPNTRPAPTSGNGVISGEEPRRVRTLSVRPDQPDVTPNGVPAPQAQGARVTTTATRPVPAPAVPTAPAASSGGPLSLSPQGAADTRSVRTASTAPAQQVASGNYLVQVSSQRTEAEAQASYRVLQGKFPSVLGSRSPVIRKADLGDKGVYYRAMVGPFGSSEEAAQLCGSLKSAGGQCVVQRN